MTRSMTVPGWQLLTFQSPSTQAKYLLQVGSQLRALTPSPASHLSISSSSVLFSAGLKKVKPEASFMEHRKTRKIFILVVLILKVAGGMILCLVLWSQSRLPSLLLYFFLSFSGVSKFSGNGRALGLRGKIAVSWAHKGGYLRRNGRKNQLFF